MGATVNTCAFAGFLSGRLVAYKFIIQIASNGNLQIEMHCFTSQQPVRSKYSSVHSRSLALVVFEQTAQSLSAPHLPLLPIQR
jgi:hypothetical protein